MNNACEDRLEAVEAQRDRYREALQGLYDFLPRYSCTSGAPDGCPVCVARAALDKTHDRED